METYLGLLTAFVLLLTAIVGYAGRRLNDQVQEIHFLVNSHAEEQANRITQLTAALTASNVVVPDKPTIERNPHDRPSS